MKPISTNISDFEALRTRGQTYVDKTAYLHRLITDPNRSYYFLARPRRFGKSLAVTTLKSIFLGHRKFFEDLAIAKTDYDWKPHAVIHFNWGMTDVSTPERFDRSLAVAVGDALRAAGYAYEEQLLPSDNLKRAIDYFYAKDGVGPAILIDEYDDPVAKALKDVPRAEAIRDRLASIYAQFKDNSGKIRFLFITGVSKFTKLSIFSTLSSLNDISFEDDYAAMCGYTEEELGANFEEHLRAHAEKMALPYERYRAELKRWYNGYRFAQEDPVTVYNPVSIALTLANKKRDFRGYWTQTGRASSLMNVIRREGLLKLDYENLEGVNDSAFDVSDLAVINPVGLLFQTGYLTIRDYSPQFDDYTLGVPDEEVRRDLTLLLAGVAANRDMDWAKSMGSQLLRGRFEPFFEGLKALYAGMAYGSLEERAHETSYARCLSFLLAAHGLRFRMEDVQADGRADVVAKHPCGIFIFELKVDEPASAALEQVRSKGYDAPYRGKELPIYLIGLGFDSKTRHLADCRELRVE
ncbi:MAG: ATP-binding protein [Kiritimatiellae bacterium]|nr:ATP-binding protein [Kiritimatiellia bacterium]